MLICQNPQHAIFGYKSLPGLTHCHLFHRHPLYMAWDDGFLGLVSECLASVRRSSASRLLAQPLWLSTGSSDPCHQLSSGHLRQSSRMRAAVLTGFLSVPSNPLAFSRISRALIPAGVPPPQTLPSRFPLRSALGISLKVFPETRTRASLREKPQIWTPEGGASEQTNLLSSNPNCPVAQNRCFLHQLSSVH